jgi:nicotinamide-nucleotide amidase
MADVLTRLSAEIGHWLQARGWFLATAESCTGGGIAETVTRQAGSSAWFDRGFITYSNAAKCDMLGVAQSTLEQYGAVSEAVVEEMVRGALQHSVADVAVAVSGVAGPSGGSAEKPVGTVCIAWGQRGQPPRSARFHFPGDRAAVRQQTIITALRQLPQYCSET